MSKIEYSRLYFRNNYRHRLWVAIMFPASYTCSQFGRWRTEGWWSIDPRGQAYVLKTLSRTAYFYAEADDGAIWDGGPNAPIMYVTQDSFVSCNLINTTGSRPVRVDRLNLGTGAFIQPLG
ncbi:DUF1036 domain-containing protein [Nonomuraea sp. NPDC002799]